MKKTTDKFEIYLQNDGGSVDITGLSEGLNWSESENGHTAGASLNVPGSAVMGSGEARAAAGARSLPRAGDKIIIKYDGEDIYTFVITTVSGVYPRQNITAADFGFYIEQNDIVIQFVGVSAKRACEDVCAVLGIECECENMSAEINGVYIDTAENILEDILEIQKRTDGREYRFEMDNKRLRIFALTNDVGVYRYKPAENVAEFDVTKEHTRCEYVSDITAMKNSVTATVKSRTDGNLPAVEFTAADSESIKKYGKLNERIDVASERVFEIETLAKNELKDKDKPTRTVSCEMYGSINARVGRVMHIVDEWAGIDALMRITEVTHSLSGGVYKMSLTLKYIEEYTAAKVTTSRVERENIELDGSTPTYYDGEKTSGSYAQLEAEARKYLGVKYVWGGYTPSGFDCSGFVCYVLNKCGYNVGRTTAQGLFDMTKRVKSPQAGDLVFWINTNPNSPNLITHVGLCIGNGKNIQASSTKGVCVASNGGAYAYGRL